MFEFKIEYYGNNYKARNSDGAYVRCYVHFIELYFGDIGDAFVYLAVMCGIGMGAYVLMLFLTNAISVKEVRKILKG